MVAIAVVGVVVYVIAQPTKEIAQHVAEPTATSPGPLPGQRDAGHDMPTSHMD
jgi:hypothetical protein